MRRTLQYARAWLGARWVHHESVPDYFARHAWSPAAGRYETVHREAAFVNPLPCNVSSTADLPDTRGWWGYSFRDVPSRMSAETFIATLPECRVVWYRDPTRANDFYPAILTGDGTALRMRELRFRDRHAEVLRRAPQPRRIPQATWVIERVYHNHSHWLSAHLPKLLLLRDRGMLDDVLLPAERSQALEDSLALAGMPASRFGVFDHDRPLLVDELTVVGTDRFRPELLRLVRQAYGIGSASRGGRRVFISRARAARRRLLNEEDVWAVLAPAGFDRVCMEALSFEAQVDLMRETDVLLAAHGAGLTNMLFCAEGTHVVEIANLSFPNPNFYAMAAAMGHRYWLVEGSAHGSVHPLEQDLTVDPAAVRRVVEQLDAG